MPNVEEELHQVLALAENPAYLPLYHILAYHLGWEGEGAGQEAAGKRVRSLLALLSTEAAGGDWQKALPAAGAVELLHNFSLIHDDIEDRSPLRRGRPTVWKIWGIPQAINAGDALFTLAHLAILRLETTISPDVALQASRLLKETSLKLTQGQHLDIAFESQIEPDLEAYWNMVSGKTAALLSACCELGALVSRANDEQRSHYRQFGHFLGLAFQARDDLLGIWGNSDQTGKSIASDITTSKYTLPVVFGLQRGETFAARWRRGNIQPDEINAIRAQLEEIGADSFTIETVSNLTRQAITSLEQAKPNPEAGAALEELALRMVDRQR